MKTIYLAGGCFWGMERLFRALPGVADVTAGYANGNSPAHANYEAVCTGITGFRETVRVDYDPGAVSLEHLLFAFFAVIDPETPNRQGPDLGSQYQAGIYWTDGEDAALIQKTAAMESAQLPFFAVEVKPLTCFFPAEEYHQRYLEKHPTGYCHVSPGKIEALCRYPFTTKSYDRPAAQLLQSWRSEEKGS